MRRECISDRLRTSTAAVAILLLLGRNRHYAPAASPAPATLKALPWLKSMSKSSPTNNSIEHVAVTDSQRRKGLFFLGLSAGLMGIAFAVQMGLNANFLGDVMGCDGLQVGVLETVRETCGIVALLVLALLAGFAEPLVAAAMLALVGVGMVGYGYAPTYVWLVVLSVVWSQGLHVWMPLPNSMVLSLAEPGRAGYRLGQLRSAGAGGYGVGIVLALILTGALKSIGPLMRLPWAKRLAEALPHLQIRPLFLVAGGAAVLSAAACLFIPRKIKTPGPRFVFRKRYGLYYLLCFLEGWRKQIFICFAGFLLVKIHGVELTTILLLHGTVQAIQYVASPMAGRLIDRVGERRVLVFYYVCLTAFFLGYARVSNLNVLFALFVLDKSFFIFGTALNTYVNKIAPPSEHTPTLSMGVAMNHVAAVTMPLVGGLLWKYYGHQWAFIAGAVAAAVSIMAAAMLPPHRDASDTAETTQ